MSGKWHVASSLTKPTDTWPLQRGFDEFYGTIIGAGSFYDPNTLTRGNENIEHEAQRARASSTPTRSATRRSPTSSEHAAASTPDTPFFEYVAYTAPHWPLHAHDEDIAKYKGRFDAGWDALREERLDKLVASRHPEARTGSSPSATRRSRRGPRPSGRAVPRLDAALHGGLRRADRPHGPGHRPHPRRARAARPARRHAGHLPRPTTAPAPRTSRRT